MDVNQIYFTTINFNPLLSRKFSKTLKNIKIPISLKLLRPSTKKEPSDPIDLCTKHMLLIQFHWLIMIYWIFRNENKGFERFTFTPIQTISFSLTRPMLIAWNFSTTNNRKIAMTFKFNCNWLKKGTEKQVARLNFCTCNSFVYFNRLLIYWCRLYCMLKANRHKIDEYQNKCPDWFLTTHVCLYVFIKQIIKKDFFMFYMPNVDPLYVLKCCLSWWEKDFCKYLFCHWGTEILFEKNIQKKGMSSIIEYKGEDERIEGARIDVISKSYFFCSVAVAVKNKIESWCCTALHMPLNFLNRIFISINVVIYDDWMKEDLVREQIWCKKWHIISGSFKKQHNAKTQDLTLFSVILYLFFYFFSIFRIEDEHPMDRNCRNKYHNTAWISEI